MEDALFLPSLSIMEIFCCNLFAESDVKTFVVQWPQRKDNCLAIGICLVVIYAGKYDDDVPTTNKHCLERSLSWK